MKNAITTLRIQNFKSIKDVEIKPRRVNLILGEPNVGKSNVLEAISLLGGMVFNQAEFFMQNFIRYEEPRQLFYDNLYHMPIRIITDSEFCVVGFNSANKKFGYLCAVREVFKDYAGFDPGKGGRIGSLTKVLNKFYNDLQSSEIDKIEDYVYTEFDLDGKIILDSTGQILLNGKYYDFENEPKLYKFKKLNKFDSRVLENYLNPPFGNNLFEVLQSLPDFRKEVGDIFKKYGQRLLLRMGSRELEVIKDLNDIVYSYPYSSIADTLQRLIFYLAAIESNSDAVLLFEEPEAHSFPTYVAQLGQRIVESENNQFFIVTHSPYLVTEIFEEMVPKDELLPQLAVFVAYYEDYQTKIRQLTDEEVVQARADGLEMFYNLNRFIPERG